MRRMSGNRISCCMLVVAVAFAIIGCVSVRNALGDRDLVCSETPDDSCIRIADVGLTLLDVDKAERDYGPIPIIKVYPTGCTMDELGVPAPGAVRCWWVEASVESGRGASVAVYERADGSLQLYGRP